MTTIALKRIALEIPAEDTEAILAAIQVLQLRLLPHLITLTAADRRELPKMGDKNLPFVKKTNDYAQAYPQFVPSFLDVAELAIDLAVVDRLTQLQRPLDQLASALDDTLLAAGSEALSTSLSFYQSVKNAAKHRIAGAKEIADDLGQRFPGHTRASASPDKT